MLLGAFEVGGRGVRWGSGTCQITQQAVVMESASNDMEACIYHSFPSGKAQSSLVSAASFLRIHSSPENLYLKFFDFAL
jgi:hypothetical protein